MKLSLQKASNIEEILMGGLPLLKQSLSQCGQWHIPGAILQKIHEVAGKKERALIEKITGNNTVIEECKTLFSNSPLATEKFCLLKIKEIKFFLLRGSSIKTSAPVTLSFLEHVESSNQASVNIVTVMFNDYNLATKMVLRKDIHVNKPYLNTLHALKLSSWLTTFDNETVIRFADRKIEETMSIRLYCEEIEYALASSTVRDSSEKDKNFWEDFAISYKNYEDDPDINLIKLVKQNVTDTFNNVKDVALLPRFSPIAKFKEDIDQTKYIERILKNQCAGMGSLLYLPTGFGKTFIVIVAMAQHYSALPVENRKPYLVVTPKNVQDAWVNNIDLLKGQFEGKNKLFADEDINYFKVTSTKEFVEYLQKIREPNKQVEYQIILITEDVLTNTVKEFYQSKEKAKNSPQITKYAELLKHGGIIIGENLVIGHDATIWKKQILHVLSYLCAPESVFQELTSELKSLLDATGIMLIDGNDEEIWKNYFENVNNLSSFYKAVSSKPELVATVRQGCHLPMQLDMEKSSRDIFNHFQGYYKHRSVINCLKPRYDPSHSAEKLFDECLGRKLRMRKQNNLLGEIEFLSKSQLDSQTKFEEFLNSFSGIITDESHILFVKKPSNVLNCRDIIFEMSDFYQTQSKINSGDNRLVIAASATPWPNELEELCLHLKFLAPKLMKDYTALNHFLFKKWDSLEMAVEEYAKNAADSSEVENIVKLASHVRVNLFQWIKNIFNFLVIYEKPNPEQSNAIDEKFLHIECKETDKVTIVPSKKSKSAESVGNESSVFNIIRKFFSRLLGNNFNPENDDAQMEIVSDESVTSSYSKAIQQCLAVIEENPYKKIALYVEEHKDALKLQQIIEEFYKKKLAMCCPEVSLFYEDDFMRKQPYNTNRIVNRNAFNNIFYYENYIFFIKERFYHKDSPRLYPATDFSKILKPLYLFFKAIDEENSEKRDQLLDESYQSKLTGKAQKGNASIINHLLDVLHDTFTQSKNKMSEILPSALKKLQKDKDYAEYKSFLLSIQTIISFEKHSQTEIIYFNDKDSNNWLRLFSPFLPEHISKQALNLDQKMDKFREYIDENVQQNDKIDDSVLRSIQYSLLYYVHYLYLSRVFIFGQAGTSGMRIDADVMFMFCGAWTEGRLTQIKGRFGRNKSGNPARRCIIYAPLTNSGFEFFILRYYILKSLYDKFVTADVAPPVAEISEPIFLSYLLYKHYNASQQFINDTIKNKVEQLEITSAGTYFSYSPLDKAKFIVPESLLQQLKTFIQIVESLAPDLPAQIPETANNLPSQPTLNALPNVSAAQNNLPYRPQAWEVKYSDQIKAYAVSKGWKAIDGNGSESDAGELLLTLVQPLPTFNVKMIWQPSELLGMEPIPANRADVALESERQIVLPKNPFINVALEPIDDTLKIDQSVFATAYRRDRDFSIQKEGSQKIRRDYKTTVTHFEIELTVEIDNIYVELTLQPEQRNRIEHIVIDDLTLGNHQYILYGYTCGGHTQGNSHFVTYRKGIHEGIHGHYICNDLLQIQFIPRELPIDSRAILFRFIRKDKLAEMLKLTPKHLTNYDNNCFVNAPFQLADSLQLRQEIEKYQKQIEMEVAEEEKKPEDTAGLSKLGNVSSVLSKSSSSLVPPKPPTIRAHCSSKWTEDDQNRLNRFCDKAKKQFILIVPSRACRPDLTLQQFSQYLEESCDNQSQILLLFGTNRTDEAELKKILEQHGKIYQKYLNSKKIFIKDIPFLWDLKDKNQGKVPLGQMRNYCLQQARELWVRLTSTSCDIHPNNIFLISADGDMRLTSKSFKRYQQKFGSVESPYLLLTFGYEILFKKQLVSKATSISVQEQLSVEFFTALANHISMNVNSRMQCLIDNSDDYVNYTGYPSEPLICLNPALTELLFRQLVEFATTLPAVFGYWDIEGRKLTEHLKILLKNNSKTLAIIPPDMNPENRPILCEYERFKKKSIPPNFVYLKQKLAKDQIAMLITRLAKQPQSSVNLYFMAQNLAAFFNKDKKFVLPFGSYFYPKHVLLLLNLGPGRMLLFAQWLRHCFVEPLKCMPTENRIEHNFMVTINELKNFIAGTFQVLFEQDSQYGKLFFDQLTQWLLNIAHQLRSWIDAEFIGEKTESDVYQAMVLPADYPKQALSLMQQEEPQETDWSGIADELHEYLCKIADYSTYTLATDKFALLKQKFNELYYLGPMDDELKCAITVYSSQELFKQHNESLLKAILDAYPTRPCILINLISVDETFRIVFTSFNKEHYVISDKLPVDNKHHHELTPTAINLYCKKLKIKNENIQQTVSTPDLINRQPLTANSTLIDSQGQKDITEDEVAYNDPNLLHLINYRIHYMPLINNQPALTQSSERSPENSLAKRKDPPIEAVASLGETSSAEMTSAADHKRLKLTLPEPPIVLAVANDPKQAALTQTNSFSNTHTDVKLEQKCTQRQQTPMAPTRKFFGANRNIFLSPPHNVENKPSMKKRRKSDEKSDTNETKKTKTTKKASSKVKSHENSTGKQQGIMQYFHRRAS